MAIEDPTANRVVVAEFDTIILDVQFVNYSPFTWVAQYGPYQEDTTSDFGNGCFGFGDFGGSETGNLGEKKGALDVGSLIVDTVEYTERASIALVEANDESWYWDQVEQKLYVHFTDHKRPSLFTVFNIGGVARCANKAVYIDDLFYESRLVDPFTINKSRDPVRDLVITHDLSELKLRNQDGAFDEVNQDPIIIGQPVRLYYGEVGDAFSAFDQVGKSYIDEIIIDWEHLVLKLLDDRKKLSRKIPLYVFNSTDFPEIKDKYLGKPIQLAFGPLFNVPLQPLDEEQASPAYFRYGLADITDYPGGVRGVSAVYVDGVELAATNWGQQQLGNPGSFPDTAYVYIAIAAVSAGQKVTADFIGLGTRNRIANSDCESTTTPCYMDQTADAPANATFARDSAQAKSGTYSYKLTKTTGAGGGEATGDLTDEDFQLATVFEGQTLTFTAWAYVPSTGGPLLSEVFIRLADNNGSTFEQLDSGNPSSYDTWERLTVTKTFRSGLTWARIMAKIDTAAAAGEYVFFDEIQVEEAASATAWILRELWDNPLRLEEHLMEEYSNIEYNTDNFDQTEWEAAVINSNTKNAAILIEKRMEIIKVIEKIQTAVVLGAFMQLDNGKWTNRIYDSGASALATISKDEFKGIPQIRYDKNYATSVEVLFSKDWDENAYRGALDDSEELVRVGAIKKYFLFDPETMMVTETDALAAAALWYDYLNNRRIARFTIGTQIITLDLMDVINVELNRINGNGLGTLLMEIIDVKKDLSAGEMEVVAREIT